MNTIHRFALTILTKKTERETKSERQDSYHNMHIFLALFGIVNLRGLANIKKKKFYSPIKY